MTAGRRRECPPSRDAVGQPKPNDFLIDGATCRRHRAEGAAGQWAITELREETAPDVEVVGTVGIDSDPEQVFAYGEVGQ